MLSSTNGSIKYSFLHNYYSPSSFNQGIDDIFFNPMLCPSSSPLNPNIEMRSSQEKDGQGLHHGPSKRRSVRKEYRVKKIHTAQGLRDRRVRLSKEVARKFFNLQDTLGFDKASKTLEWLLNESGKAIEQLGTRKTVSSNSEEGEKQLPLSVGGAKGKSAGLEGAVGVNKESRAKARARARERTMAKTTSNDRLVICHEEENFDNFFQFDPLKQLPGWSLSTQEYLEDDGQNPFVVVEAQEVDEPRSKTSRAQESILLTKWFTGC